MSSFLNQNLGIEELKELIMKEGDVFDNDFP